MFRDFLLRAPALVTKTALGDEEIMPIIVFSRPDPRSMRSINGASSNVVEQQQRCAPAMHASCLLPQ